MKMSFSSVHPANFLIKIKHCTQTTHTSNQKHILHDSLLDTLEINSKHSFQNVIVLLTWVFRESALFWTLFHHFTDAHIPSTGKHPHETFNTIQYNTFAVQSLGVAEQLSRHDFNHLCSVALCKEQCAHCMTFNLERSLQKLVWSPNHAFSSHQNKRLIMWLCDLRFCSELGNKREMWRKDWLGEMSVI